LTQTTAAPLSLRRNFSWTLVGNTFYALCQWGIIVAYAKLTSPEEVGRFAVGVAVTGPAVMFSNLSLRAVLVTDAKRDYEFQDYLRLRLICTAVVLMGIVVFACSSQYDREAKWIIVAVALAKAFESISDIYYGVLQQHERMERVAISLILRGALALTAVTAAVALTRSALWGSFALAAAWLVPLLLFDRPGAMKFVPRGPYSFDHNRVVRLAWLALPLGSVAALTSLSANIPRYFVANYAGVGQLGIFSALTYFTFAGTQAMSALGQSSSPRLARYYSRSDAGSYLKLLGRLFGIGLALGVLGIAVAGTAGHTLLRLFYTEQYAAQAPVLTWLMVATLVGYLGSAAGYGVTAMRSFRIQLPIFFLSTAATAVFCMIFVRPHGMLGAAWAMAGGGLVSLILMWAYVYHALRELKR
jgi:O-antigen/teichoic acid export membrane protein